MKKTRKKANKGGRIISGTLFIGDPVFMSAPSEMQLDANGELINAVEPDKYNPFKRREDLIDKLHETGDLELEVDQDYPGRGCLLVVNGLWDGKFTVKKSIDKTSGKIKKVTIEFK